MKKTISLLLALALCLSLCACGEGAGTPTEITVPKETVMTKEEMLSIATNYYSGPLSSEISENIAKANATYLNQTVSIMGISITEINLDYAVSMDGFVQYNIYLPLEELAELKVGDYVRVVGTITKFENATVLETGTSMDMVSVDIKPAYIADKCFELNNGGVSYIRTDGNGNKYCLVVRGKLIGSYENYIVYFSADDTQRIEDLMETQIGATISLHGNLTEIKWEDGRGPCPVITDAVIDNLE